MNNDDTKPMILVKKSDSKKGSLWNKLVNHRIIKQHGGFDIPEDDLHAIPKYRDPLERQEESPDEKNAKLSDIEEQIKRLREKDK